MEPSDLKWVRRFLLCLGGVLAILAVIRVGVLVIEWWGGPVAHQADLMLISLIGVAALAILIATGAIPGFKALGVEVSVASAFVRKTNEHNAETAKLEERLSRLERLLKDPLREGGGPFSAVTNIPSEYPPPPALLREQVDVDDQWKGRFGGVASRGHFTLGAAFGPLQAGGFAEIDLHVDAEVDVPDGTVCEFFLHQTFKPDRVRAVFKNRVAKFDVLAWGSFVVGAWIPHAGVELELDLTQMSQSPWQPDEPKPGRRTAGTPQRRRRRQPA